MDLDEALDTFRKAQKDKFLAVAHKYSGRGVVGQGAKCLDDPEVGASWEHFLDEVREFTENPEDSSEAVDVANCAFVLWWQLKEAEVSNANDE